MLRHQAVQRFFQKQDFFRLDFNVHGLSLGTAKGLVDHDPCVREGKAFALASSAEQERAHARGQPIADGHHVRGDLLHRVVDGQPGCDGAPR